jgi:NAD(P)-dependent dehydrogenase (short-subunit alcohol dehydrogenase family)
VIASSSDSVHVIMAGRSLKKVESAKSEIVAGGIIGQLSTLQLNIIDDKSIALAVKEVQENFGHLDVLVNNAGIANVDPNVKTRFQICLETNVTGTAMVADAFRPLLLKSKNPYSIYMSSGRGSITRSSEPAKVNIPVNDDAYQASKAALNMVAVREWVEFGPAGLKVFVVCPGLVRSNLRGPSEEAKSGWGQAGDPQVSGETILSILEGKRDANVGKFIHKDGVYPW